MTFVECLRTDQSMNSEKNNSYKTRETLLAKLKNKHDDASWEDFVYYYKSYIYIICRKIAIVF